jgi:hypothetical protein
LAKATFLRRPFLVKRATRAPLIRSVMSVKYDASLSFLVFLDVDEDDLVPDIPIDLPPDVADASARAWALYLECGGREHLALLRYYWQHGGLARF